MMTEKPNCGNCPFCDRDTGTWDYCNEGDFAIDPLETKEKIEIVGCLSHPGAREYLMAPVIKELERKRTKAQKEITREFLEQDTYREGIVKMCGEAIILIRDGVK